MSLEKFWVFDWLLQHPFLLEAWLKRQDGIGKIIKTYFWGHITVQKRERIKYEE